MKTLYTRETDAPKDWHFTEIESAVKRAFGSYAGLARTWNDQNPAHQVSRFTLQKSARKRQSALGEQVISWALGVPPSQIWPSRYDAAGNRTSMRSRNDQQCSAEQGARPSKASVFASIMSAGDCHE